MIDPEQLSRNSDALAGLMKTKIGTGGKTLESRLTRAGRRLPRRLRNDARTILAARSQASHPKLAAMVDPVRLDQAFSNVNSYLRDIDPKDRRKGKLLGWLGYQVASLLLIALALIAILRWRGYIG